MLAANVATMCGRCFRRLYGTEVDLRTLDSTKVRNL
jgi:hypothetical protein